MNLTLAYSDQMGRGIGQTVLRELEQLVAGIVGHWQVDHATDGTHGAIHEYGRTVPSGVFQPLDLVAVTDQTDTEWDPTLATTREVGYVLHGKTATLFLNVGPFSVDGSPRTLRVRLPDVLTPDLTIRNTCWTVSNGQYDTGTLRVLEGDRYVDVFRNALEVPWAPSDRNSAINGQITFPIR